MTAKARKTRCKTTALGLLAVSFGLLASSCGTPAKSKFSIDVAEPEVKIIRRKDVETNLTRQPTDHESAQTDWVFSLVPELDFSIKEEKKEANGFRIAIELTGVRLKLALPIKVMIDSKAPKSIEEHENGHVQICRRIYANCRNYAQDAVKNAIGKRFEGFGADRKMALSSALQQAAQEVAAPYRGKAVVLAEAVSSRYDQLCELKGYDGKIQRAIDDAFSQVEVAIKNQKMAQDAQTKSQNSLRKNDRLSGDFPASDLTKQQKGQYTK